MDNFSHDVVFSGITPLAQLFATMVGEPTLSFVRVDGDDSPAGLVMKVGEERIDVSTEEGN